MSNRMLPEVIITFNYHIGLEVIELLSGILASSNSSVNVEVSTTSSRTGTWRHEQNTRHGAIHVIRASHRHIIFKMSMALAQMNLAAT